MNFKEKVILFFHEIGEFFSLFACGGETLLAWYAAVAGASQTGLHGGL